MDALKAEIRKQSTDMILDAVLLIGGGPVDTERRMVRAALIDVYAERTSQDEADKLIDFIGL